MDMNDGDSNANPGWHKMAIPGAESKKLAQAGVAATQYAAAGSAPTSGPSPPSPDPAVEESRPAGVPQSEWRAYMALMGSAATKMFTKGRKSPEGTLPEASDSASSTVESGGTETPPGKPGNPFTNVGAFTNRLFRSTAKDNDPVSMFNSGANDSAKPPKDPRSKDDFIGIATSKPAGTSQAEWSHYLQAVEKAKVQSTRSNQEQVEVTSIPKASKGPRTMLSAAEQAKQFRSPAAEMEAARLALELRRNAERLAAKKEKAAAAEKLTAVPTAAEAKLRDVFRANPTPSTEDDGGAAAVAAAAAATEEDFRSVSAPPQNGPVRPPAAGAIVTAAGWAATAEPGPMPEEPDKPKVRKSRKKKSAAERRANLAKLMLANELESMGLSPPPKPTKASPEPTLQEGGVEAGEHKEMTGEHDRDREPLVAPSSDSRPGPTAPSPEPETEIGDHAGIGNNKRSVPSPGPDGNGRLTTPSANLPAEAVRPTVPNDAALAAVPAPAKAALTEPKPRRSRKKKTAAERREALAKLGIDVELELEATPDEPAAPPLPAVAVELGLSATDLPVYHALWAASGAVEGVLKAQVAFGFFTKSGLGMATLREMWNVAHTEGPKGQLNETEFFRACKLVALAQSGIWTTLSADILNTPTDLPKIEVELRLLPADQTDLAAAPADDAAVAADGTAPDAVEEKPKVRRSRKKKTAAERREALAKLGGAVPLENGLMTAGDDDWLFGAASLRSTPWEVPSVEKAKLAKETHVFAEVPVQQTEDDLLAEPEKPVATAIIAADPDDDDPLGGDDQLFGGAMGIF